MGNKFLGTGAPGYHPLRKVRVVLAGLRFAVLHDFSVTYKLVLSVLVLAVALHFHQWVDALLILVATGVVLAAELFNSAVEAIADFVEPEENWKIAVIKDIAAAATGVTIAVWAIVLGTETWRLWLAKWG